MPKLESFFGGPNIKPDKNKEDPDREKQIAAIREAAAKKAAARKEGVDARESLKRAFEEEGLDNKEEEPVKEVA